ncbi:protein kinase [Campylobacter jejuni]|uniref:protein kinase n=1 Tax=Campylobacter jejuni TaxID=197 RepID=UPI003B99F3A7
MEYTDFILEKYIKNYNQKLSNNERISLDCQVLRGIEILWNNNILHRNISFNNILLKLYDNIYPVIKFLILD